MGSTITIKKGEKFILVVDRNEFISADQMPDGIIFKFKNGLSLMYTHMEMPLVVKEQITAAVDSFNNASLEIDLHNYVKPVKAILR